MPLAKRKKNRLILIVTAGAVLAAAVALTAVALNDEIVFFKTPSDIATEGLEPGVRVRVGGLVKEGTVVRGTEQNLFTVTDLDAEIAVVSPISVTVPALFREGQGVVLEGARNLEGTFVATRILAKHDENYIPVEVAEALKGKGQWKGADDALKTLDDAADGSGGYTQ
ncbi:MAG: cytochrome c maturation protein CcmE [Pseudomonadota bacterium]